MQHLNNTDTHRTHTICTQFAHTQNTDTRYIYAAQNKTQNTAQTPQQRTTHLQHSYALYSFDFYDEHIYIKKLYNTAIYKLYTNFIHFGHLINKVSKITNIDILIKTYT